MPSTSSPASRRLQRARSPAGGSSSPPNRLNSDTDLLAVLDEGRRRGLLGPGPVGAQVAHARRFAEAAGSLPDRCLDLGSGGGLPGLVLAATHDARWVLLDGRRRSGEFLSEAVARLGLQARVQVVVARAENVGRDPAHRGAYGLVVARSFGPPAVTAECAAPLLEEGGRLVVSEPPDAALDRWSAAGLADLGLALSNTRGFEEAHFAVLFQLTPCPERFPRRPGVPAKRPWFG